MLPSAKQLVAASILSFCIGALSAPARAQVSSAPQPSPAAQASAAESAPSLARLRAQAHAFRAGQTVRVHLIEGGVVRGRVLAATDEALTIQPTPSDEPQLIAYDQMRSLSSGMRPWAKIAIGAGAVGAIVLAVAVAQ